MNEHITQTNIVSYYIGIIIIVFVIVLYCCCIVYYTCNYIIYNCYI